MANHLFVTTDGEPCQGMIHGLSPVVTQLTMGTKSRVVDRADWKPKANSGESTHPAPQPRKHYSTTVVAQTPCSRATSYNHKGAMTLTRYGCAPSVGCLFIGLDPTCTVALLHGRLDKDSTNVQDFQASSTICIIKVDTRHVRTALLHLQHLLSHDTSYAAASKTNNILSLPQHILCSRV